MAAKRTVPISQIVARAAQRAASSTGYAIASVALPTLGGVDGYFQGRAMARARGDDERVGGALGAVAGTALGSVGLLKHVAVRGTVRAVTGRAGTVLAPSTLGPAILGGMAVYGGVKGYSETGTLRGTLLGAVTGGLLDQKPLPDLEAPRPPPLDLKKGDPSKMGKGVMSEDDVRQALGGSAPNQLVPYKSATQSTADAVADGVLNVVRNTTAIGVAKLGIEMASEQMRAPRKSQTANGARAFPKAMQMKNFGNTLIAAGGKMLLKGEIIGDKERVKAGAITAAAGIVSRDIGKKETARLSGRDGLIARGQGGSAALGMRGIAAPGKAFKPGPTLLNVSKGLNEGLNAGMAEARAKTKLGAKGPMGGMGEGMREKYEALDKAERFKQPPAPVPAPAKPNDKLSTTLRGDYTTVDGRSVKGTPAQQAAWARRRSI
jgi:hypothetical protein